MKDFFELTKLKDDKFDAFETYKNPAPFFIYGAGFIAKKVKAFLDYKQIPFEGFILDDEYCQNKSLNFMGKTIFPKSKINFPCCIIVGFAGIESDIKKSFAKNQNVKEIIFCDFTGRMINGEQRDLFFTTEWIKENYEVLNNLYKNLQDDKSRECLYEYIEQRLTGKYSKSYELNQYFVEDIISLSEDEVFIDCGAFDGGTIIDFERIAKLQRINNFKCICFEPDPDNIKIMKKKLSHLNNIVYEEAGVYKESTLLRFNSGHESSSCFSQEGDIEVSVKSIDDVLHGEKATFIKMDIEGAELDALKGAEKTIKSYKPKLAICIYHKRSDLIDIPLYIKSLNPDYKFYIRNHHSTGIETVLYAI